MLLFLGILCVILCIIIGLLVLKVIYLHHGIEEIYQQFAARLSEDTNVGIDVSTSDKKLRKLASEIDKQLKCLRKEHIRYVRGDQELKEAVTNISHDLRTPLTAVCGYLELLGRLELSQEAREYYHIIENRITSLKQLTEELFRYSVVVSVKAYEGRELVILNELLEECIAGAYTTLKKAGIEPDIVMPEQRIERQLNRAALVRILENLISNAVKYSDGDLKIILQENGIISFSNHASSLDEVSVSRLFERYYTVETGQNSTGLGLSIARVLAEQMQGRITARKKGEIFTVELFFLTN